MTDVAAAEARKHFAELLNRVAYGKERVVLTRHGKQLCALVPVEDLSLLERLREAVGRHDVAAALDAKGEGALIGWTELKREMGLDR